MAQGYLAQVQALIAERMKENPEEMKRKLKEIEEAKNKAKEAPKSPPKPLIISNSHKLIEELNKESTLRIQVVKDLIKRGADIKAKDKYETTVLHWASYFGDIELAKECLQAGIDVNTKNKSGITPLHWAVWRDIELVKLLIDSGAKVNSKDKWGRTPLDRAKSEEMKALLKQHGAK